MAKTSYPAQIITPEGMFFEGQVVSLRLPGTSGEFGVLARHAPMLAALAAGAISFETADGKREELIVGEGFAEVGREQVRVLVDSCERPGEVDVERAERALARARERLDAGKVATTDLDFLRAEAAMRRAMVRLRMAKKPRL